MKKYLKLSFTLLIIVLVLLSQLAVFTSPVMAQDPALEPTSASTINLSPWLGRNVTPRVAASGSNVYLVWWERFFGMGHIFYRKSTDNGVTFSETGYLNIRGEADVYPQIAATGSNVYIAWEQAEGHSRDGWSVSTRDIFLAISDNNGSTFDIINLSNTFGNSWSPRIAANGSNQVFVIWVEAGWCDPEHIGLYCAKVERQQDGQLVITESCISPNYYWGFMGSHCIAASNGNVYVAWANASEPPKTSPYLVDLVLSRNSGTGFEPPILLGSMSPYWNIEMAAYGSNVYVTWLLKMGEPIGYSYSYDYNYDVFLGVSHDNGTSFVVVNLSNSEYHTQPAAIRVSGSNVYVVWTDFKPSNYTYPWSYLSDGLMYLAVSSNNFTSYSVRDLGRGYTGSRGQGLAVSDGYVSIAYIAPSEGPIDPSWMYQIDVFLIASNDGGYSFSSPINLSENKGDSYFPTIAASGPFIYVAWTDNSFATSPPSTFKFHWLESAMLFKLVYLGKPDLVLEEVKPVQAPSDPDVLVDGKKTLLKITLFSGLPEKKDAGIRLIYETVDDSGTETTVMKDEVKKVNPGKNVFYLPSDVFIKPKKPDFLASVILDPNNTIAESDEDNNAKTIIGFPVKDTKPFRVLYVPLQLPGDTAPNAYDMTIFGIKNSQYLVGTYPISDDEFEMTVSVTPLTEDALGIRTSERLDENQLTQLFVALSRLYVFSDRVVAVVRDGWFKDHTIDYQDAIGLSTIGLSAVIVEQKCLDGATTAHEIAHSFDWVTAGNPVEDPDSESHTKSLPAPGYWVAKRLPKTYPPTVDFMDSSGPVDAPVEEVQWISEETFDYLLQQLKVDPADPKVIGISGILFKNGTMMLDPWYRFNSTLDIPLGNTGNITILYADEYGSTIDQTGFNISFYGPHRVETDAAGFVLKIPDVEGAAKIIIRNATHTLAQRIISPNAPQISVKTPNGGEVFEAEDPINVTWQSSDPDGDALTYVVSFSTDGGHTWIPLATDLTNTEFTFQSPLNVFSNTSLIRVTACDGVNTAEDTSDSAFTVMDLTRLNLSKTASALDTPVIAISGSNVYVVWKESGYPNLNLFFTRSTDNGATFDSATSLFEGYYLIAPHPQIAVSGSNVYVVWTGLGPTSADIFFRASTDNGVTFGPIINLSNNTGGSSQPRIAAYGNDVYVVWSDSTNSNNLEILLRRSTDNGATFGPIIDLSNTPVPQSGDSSGDPQIVVSDKNVYVVWREQTFGGMGYGDILFRASADGGDTFGPAINLSNSTAASHDSKIATYGNNVYVVWVETGTGTQYGLPIKDVFFRRSTDNGTSFDTAINLSNTRECYYNQWEVPFPNLAASGSNVYVVWSNRAYEELILWSSEVWFRRSTDNGATFEKALNVSNDADSSIYPQIGASGSYVHVAWLTTSTGTNPHDILLRKSASNGASFGSVIKVNNNSYSSSFLHGILGVGGHLQNMAASGKNTYLVWMDYFLPDWSKRDVIFGRVGFIKTDAVNQPPAADAGVDRTVNEGTFVVLNGAGSSDPDGDMLTYWWTQVDGPHVNLSGFHSATPTFIAPSVVMPTALAFQLIVNDGATDSAPATVQITVLPPPAPEFPARLPQFDIFLNSTIYPDVELLLSNERPTADAGANQTANRRTLVTLDGRTSSDPDGDALAFWWTQTAGPPVTLLGADTATPSFTTPQVSTQTTLTFQLTVHDGKVQSEPDIVQITVTAEIDSTPPTIGIPSRDPPGDVQPNQPVKISVNVTDTISQVKNVTLYYTLNNGTTWEEPIPMNLNASTNLYEATIPGQPADTWVKYKIIAYDNAGNNATLDGTEPYCAYQVIPEFPSTLVFLLFMTVTLIAVILHKRKQPP